VDKSWRNTCFRDIGRSAQGINESQDESASFSAQVTPRLLRLLKTALLSFGEGTATEKGRLDCRPFCPSA